MGNKNTRIIPEHVAVFDKLGIEDEEKKKIIDLFERALAYSNTFIGADETYFQCKRKLSIRHFLCETGIEPPYFAAKCFELFDLTASDDVIGWLDLNEFTCALWNFLDAVAIQAVGGTEPQARPPLSYDLRPHRDLHGLPPGEDHDGRRLHLSGGALTYLSYHK